MAVPASRAPSFWLDEAFEAEGHAPYAPALEGETRADICIVGGGFTGLWTALHLKALQPALDIALIEAKYCGYGASGRNAGMLLSWSAKFEKLNAMAGAQEAVRLHRAARAAVEHIVRFAGEHGIACGLRRSGWVWTASNAAQANAWGSTVDALDRAGEHPFRVLNAQDARALSGMDLASGGLFDPDAATLQPAQLVRGLRRVALAKGVRLYENTPMAGLESGAKTAVRTPKGRIVAGKVVLALIAWAAGLRPFRRSVLVVASDQLVTAPIKERLARAGVPEAASVGDSRLLIWAYRTTPDGRLNFSKGGGDFGFAGRIGERFDSHATRADEVMAQLRRTLPQLADVPVAASWRGQVTRTKTGLPFFGTLAGKPDVLYGHGYSGNGVGPSWMGGRILASMALGHRDEWTAFPMARGIPDGRFPPEPLRYVGAYMVRGAVVRKERAEDAERTPSRLDVALASLAPSSLVPTRKGAP